MANKKQAKIVDIGKENVTEIVGSLKDNGEVYVRNLGKFTARQLPDRKGYMPHLKGYVDLPKTKRVVFQLSKGLKRLL